ncbi:ankyrin repeat-containing domain protein [Alternaria rosae]|uniref:ankyrin repeat-containing domain protein n=1 Tax=Alternaria rosae TaxID=1187941 RepID=UPI001E8EE0B5|nr:ankyrin repeat-containing domain protein [Alternaria rosae]KAH6873357.1 ankyrin repeat-containing domain protein [Alternaria rosae]
MKFLELPGELFDTILHFAINARGLKRGLRLRLINHHFAREIIRVLYTFHLLDELVFNEPAIRTWEEIYFFQSYAEYRVLHEPSYGNRFLNDVRKVAIQMLSLSAISETDGGTIEHVIHILCATKRRSKPLGHHWKTGFNSACNWDPEEYNKQCFGAALCTNRLSYIRRSATLRDTMLFDLPGPTTSCLFGEYNELAGRYGNEELLEYLMTSGTPDIVPKMRSRFFGFATRAGRMNIVRFLYNFRSAEWPWDFECDADGNRRPLENILDGGHNPKVWDFVETMRIAKGLPPASYDTVDIKLYNCAKIGYLDIVSHLVRIGEYANGDRTSILHIAVKYASERGHVAIVQLLLDNGANPNITLEGAARRGHGKLVQILLDRGVNPSEALVDAGRYCTAHAKLLANVERGPYLDVVRLLLDAGVDVNESIGKDSPLAGAIAAEHTSLFEFLLERGADLHSPGTAEECMRRAKKDGLETMLLLLEKHGVDVNVGLEEAA